MLTDHVGGNCVLLFLTESFDSVMTIPPVGETCYRDEWAIACGFGEWGGFRLIGCRPLMKVSGTGFGIVEWVTSLLFNVWTLAARGEILVSEIRYY